MSQTDNLQEADGKEEPKKITEIENTVDNPIEESTEESTNVISGAIQEEESIPKEKASNVTVAETPQATEENQGEEIVESTKKTSEKEASGNNKTKEDDGLDEIDESNAEDAEDEGNTDRHKIEFKDYENMSLEMLAIELDKLVKNEKVQAIKKHVDAIKNEFNTKFDALLDEKKEEFISEGGHEIDFYYSNPIKKRFNDSYREYRNKLNSHYKSIQENLKQNLEERLAIIEEIKGLINVEENINTTYKHFKELQERWRNAGPIPRDKYNNAWNSYHHHVEIFYDFLHLNRDLRDLDFKHNYEQKLKIIERAEELAQEDDSNHAFRELQVLHKLWKEDLGPVAREHREEVWERFKKATKTIHEKRQEYFKGLDSVYEKNLEKKQAIIEKIENIAAENGNSHGFWQKKIKEVEALREEFFEAGKVPVKVNEATWSKFKETVRNFNRKKNNFYKDLKKDQLDNLQKKLDLIKIAEDNKDNTDFATTTPLMKKIQNDWKKIGHVPRKDSDKIWKQFKNACNHYFDKFHASLNEANKEEMEVYNKKNELLEELKNHDFSKNKEKGIEVTDIAKRLMDFGFHAPTVSFPVAGTLMIEPTESENKNELDKFVDALVQIKKEIEMYEGGDSVLKNAPHTLNMITSDDWNYSYSRSEAAFALPYLKMNKYWPTVRRANEAQGDRNLICTCNPIEDYIEENA